MKKFAIALAVCGGLFCSPVHAKTFVGVLWPMFGPLPAIGLVELVSELKTMPDIEVKTYLHQQWPTLVEDIDRQPPGTHTVVVGYSLGANSSAFVANKARYVDLIIALQPSMLSWNPPITGKVGRIVEIYNPNPWMTFGGMGSKKLVGENIEYVANNDSHPGAQFNSKFRNRVKNEIAKFTAADRVETAQAKLPTPVKLAQLPPQAKPEPAERRPTQQQKPSAATDRVQIAEVKKPEPAKPIQLAEVEEEQPKSLPKESVAFLDTLSRSVNSGDLFVQRRLTREAMKRYAERTYRGSPTAGLTKTAASD
jgi:hypothetical protein